MSSDFNTVDQLASAMTFHRERHAVLAGNVANVDTPGFKASQVNFESVLDNAMTRSKPGAPVNQTALDAAASQSTLSDATTARADGNNVDIDQQMELLSEANLNYSALTQVMSTRLAILRGVIKGQ